MPPDFRHFAAIDWSGATGERHAGIAVAICHPGHAAPALVRPGHRWSRAEVLDWLLHDLPPPAPVTLMSAKSVCVIQDLNRSVATVVLVSAALAPLSA